MHKILSKMIGLMALSLASMAQAEPLVPAPGPVKQPEMPKSIANVNASHYRNGPLFVQAEAAFAAAKKGGQPALAAFLTKNAELELNNTFSSPPVEKKLLDIHTIRAIIASCDGPLSYDEGRNWVQINWVCRVDEQSIFSKYYTFRYSPEISMFISFEDNKIKSIDAGEVLMIPGKKSLPMDAYVAAHGKN